MIRIHVGDLSFSARLERDLAPMSCAALIKLLPLRERLVHARWSGEATWVPLGDLSLGLTYENATSYPAPGQLLLYPGGVSETEILIPYGFACFASKAGQLAGNHFATVEVGRNQLAELGRRVLLQGAQDVVIEAG